MPAQDVPAPPPPPGIKGQVTVEGKILTSPQAVYSGLVHQREELKNQMEALREERGNVGTWLRNDGMDQTDKVGLQQRMTAIDARIEALDKQIAAVDAQVASAAAVPGAVVEPPPPPGRSGPPEEVFILGGIFLFVAIFPISIAYARRIWRRGAAIATALPHDIVERFAQLDQAVESIAVEVERIGEGQRFITRVLSENGGRAALGEGAARPVEVQSREASRVREPGR
ncbi:MAG TPA: hypothetical protein VGP25_15850 [Gemmatimonadaceae bacterium]|nr:hypothetical protein [Gemmatimonadaceae bacterium]